ncbi:MAG: response regulator transcription factor [Oscillospiraceae bacterium]|nr:response regulator transcription factor [Oscillospiraceae bacterium]
MKIRILLVDDEPVVRENIRHMLCAFDNVEIVGEADGITRAVELLKTTRTDAVISDIQMGDGTGFDLATAIHRLNPHMPVAFLTGFAQFALAGYDYGPVDFLVKPVTHERLAQTVQRIADRLYPEEIGKRDVFVGIQSDQGYEIINVRKILYLEKDQRKVKIVMSDGSFLRSSQSMQDLEEILSEYNFIRCHQSYIVSLSAVESLHKDSFGRSYWLTLCDSGTSIPLSRRKFAEIKDMFQQRGINCY